MRKFLIMIFIVLFPSVMMGQRTVRPEWTYGYHIDKPNSSVDVFSATGHSEGDARQKAIDRAVAAKSIAAGQRVNVYKSSGEDIVVGENELTVKCRIVGEYKERLADSGEYRVFLLVQTARKPNLAFERVTIGEKYPVSARILVPGMAQIHKGSIGKGSVMIAGEVVAVAGVVAFEGMRSSYIAKMNQTHDVNVKKQYLAKATNMSNLRNGFIVGAASVYVWSLIDGIVAKGKMHVTVDDKTISFAPHTTGYSAGIMLSMNF